MTKWLSSVRGEHVAFTGGAWTSRPDLRRLVVWRGGIPTPGSHVTEATTVLVRGKSSVWSHGEHGDKEQRAADLIRTGHSIAVVSDTEFRKLLSGQGRARVLDRVAGQPLEWLEAPPKKAFVETASIAGPLDREYTTRGRVEQGYLRGTLFGDSEVAQCALCGRKLPVNLLIAAHIKPRSECSRKERLDAKGIIFAACLMGCDALYEQGLVTVDEQGKIRTVHSAGSAVLGSILAKLKGRKCPAWSETNAAYFAWHVSHRFQG